MAYSEVEKKRAWQKADAISGKNENLYRRDRYGATMRYLDYGKTTAHGWSIEDGTAVHWTVASVLMLGRFT